MTTDDKQWQPWPADWPARKNGADCVLCTFVATEDPDWGLKVYTGQVANAYLSTRGQMPGYCWVIWRDGHVCEPTDLDPADAQRFFADMLTVGRVLDQVLQPAKMNYEILGNSVPHLHAHLTPRPQTDPAPGGPLPWTYLDEGRPDPHTVRELADQLRRQLADSAGGAAAEADR